MPGTVLGFERALVQMRGDIACGAPPRGHDGWTIDVGGESRVVHDHAIATSGDAEQYAEIDGTRYSHVVDPRTGLGRTTRTSVIVAAQDEATADALATAIGVFGEADIEPLLERFDAVLLRRERVRGFPAGASACDRGAGERPFTSAPAGRRLRLYASGHAQDVLPQGLLSLHPR